MRLLFVIATIASMLFAADAAYAMGGGGRDGDGRRDVSQPANAALQGGNDQNDSPGNRGRAANAALQGVNDQGNRPGNQNNQPALLASVSVTEPMTALLLGIGFCMTAGFVVTKRRRKS